MFLWQDIVPLVVIAQAIDDYLVENHASVYHERNATKIATHRPVLLLVQHYDRGIFPSLRYTPAPPYADHNGMELLQYLAITITIFIHDEFGQLGRKLMGSKHLGLPCS